MSSDHVAERARPDYGDEPPGPLHRFSVAQYDAMARAGILGPDDRVELLGGFLVEKMTKHPPHRIATRCAREAIAAVLPAGWYVDSQEPIVTEDSEPEPDVAVIRGTTRDYANGNPPASAVALVVEVADATLPRDRALKAAIYARAGIATYWIVNITDRRIEILSSPTDARTGAHYAARREAAAGEWIDVTIEGAVVGTVAVSDLLP